MVCEQCQSVVTVADVCPMQDDVVLDIPPVVKEGIRQIAFTHIKRRVLAQSGFLHARRKEQTEHVACIIKACTRGVAV